jgi:hypothetical protein
MRVLRIDERLAAVSKPLLYPVETFSLNADDCLVLCAGFEERVLGALEMALAKTPAFRVILIRYLPHVQQNCFDTIVDKCNRAGIACIPISYDRRNPAGFGNILCELVGNVDQRIHIDISGMSRLLIVQILVALANRPEGLKDCSVLYAEAKTYPPTQAEAQTALAKLSVDPTYCVFFLSSGVFQVTVVPELSSIAVPVGQTRLIAFPSLDSYQLIAVRAEVQPSRFTFINGIPPDPKNAWRTGAIQRINSLDKIQHDACDASTLDYRQTLNCLLETYAKHSERERLLICPTGSKMQTVAVGLFRAFMDDVQIVYPTPKDFHSPSNYTTGTGPIYSLNLDNFAEEALRNTLGSSL